MDTDKKELIKNLKDFSKYNTECSLLCLSLEADIKELINKYQEDRIEADKTIKMLKKPLGELFYYGKIKKSNDKTFKNCNDIAEAWRRITIKMNSLNNIATDYTKRGENKDGTI